MAETKGVLLPAYVVADESASMGPYQQELSGGVTSLCEGLRAEPVIAAKLCGWPWWGSPATCRSGSRWPTCARRPPCRS